VSLREIFLHVMSSLLRSCHSESTALGVRREKAALSSGCKPHPATAPAGSNLRYDMRAMLGSLLRALAKTPSQPERGIRVAEVHR